MEKPGGGKVGEAKPGGGFVKPGGLLLVLPKAGKSSVRLTLLLVVFRLFIFSSLRFLCFSPFEESLPPFPDSVFITVAIPELPSVLFLFFFLSFLLACSDSFEFCIFLDVLLSTVALLASRVAREFSLEATRELSESSVRASSMFFFVTTVFIFDLELLDSLPLELLPLEACFAFFFFVLPFV